MEFKTVVNNVKNLIKTDENINKFLEMLQTDVHASKYIRVLHARNRLKSSMDVSLNTDEIRGLFTELQNAGAGRYIKGRISSARFVWEFRYIDLIEAVFPDDYPHPPEEEDYSVESYFDVDDDSYNERLINHPIILREDMVAFIQLPVLIEYKESERLSSFISSIALGEIADDEMIEHTYTLRPDLDISLHVPMNLTERECYRLQQFVAAYTDSDF